MKKARERGENPDGMQEIYARVINYAIAERPADMMITTHVCRGNFRSTWISSGGYEPVADIMLGKLNYDGYFLEYDSARAGCCNPRRFVRKGTIAVLGLLTTKSAELDTMDDVKRRIDDASRHLPLDQLALSPQCGFSSGVGAVQLAQDEQWRKFERIMETARAVWGTI